MNRSTPLQAEGGGRPRTTSGQTRMNRGVAGLGGLPTASLIACLVAVGAVRADSVLPLLGKFNRETIAALYPPTDESSQAELSKLIYRLRTLDPQILAERASDPKALLDTKPSIGDAAVVEGRIRSVTTAAVPEHLVEFLEIPNLNIVDLEVDREADSGEIAGSGEIADAGENADSGRRTTTDAAVRVVTAGLPDEAKAGDRIRGIGVLIEIGVLVESDTGDANATSAGAAGTRVYAAARVKWSPQSSDRVGWQMLGGVGVDVNELANLGSRTRLPLMSEDGQAFYGMLSAAAKLSAERSLPPPQPVDALALLSAGGSSATAGSTPGSTIAAGDWVRIPLQTVQITRVAVTQRNRRQELGRDHYFQIDAVADLGNVEVKIERRDGQNGPAATFENRFPVSLVTAELPEFLRREVMESRGGDATVADVSVAVTVDAFFFRLWSYSTDFMDQFGGGDQIGPLLVAARINERETLEDPAGVAAIGGWAAASVLTAIIAIVIWNVVLAGRDREVRAKRSEQESQRIELPDETSM